MALYDFTCRSCGHGRSVLADFETASDLELVCTACGGTMKKAVVLAVNIVSVSGDGPPPERAPKSCGHGYACRCSVRLSRPNPFGDEIKKANTREPEF
ncbi:MAG TPA: zinc ribbon domain-containing protein [Dongiaceae bacterium]|nr:zinc ribbon domain-containing protein [Dongiaceae bacterium]